MQYLAAHASEFVSIACALLGAFGGLWAAFHRLDLLLKARIREHAASKDDVARVEAKVDLVVSALIVRRPERSRK